jgi:hypothetical protein
MIHYASIYIYPFHVRIHFENSQVGNQISDFFHPAEMKNQQLYCWNYRRIVTFVSINVPLLRSPSAARL